MEQGAGRRGPRWKNKMHFKGYHTMIRGYVHQEDILILDE